MFDYKNDKTVAEVRESRDYGKFKVWKKNRGKEETDGLDRRKLDKMQKLVDQGLWRPELNKVFVNLEGIVIEGRHSFEICKINELPVHYQVVKDKHFNKYETDYELTGEIYGINTSGTHWTGDNLFNAAIQHNVPLAKHIRDLIFRFENAFNFGDVLALLTKNEIHFKTHSGVLRASIFTDPNLKKILASGEFDAEIRSFAKINGRAIAAKYRKSFLRAAYLILNRAKHLVNTKLFRDHIPTIPITKIQSHKYRKVDEYMKLIIDHVNEAAGKSYVYETIKFEIYNQLSEEKKQLAKKDKEAT